jgi:hypothetical protein
MSQIAGPLLGMIIIICYCRAIVRAGLRLVTSSCKTCRKAGTSPGPVDHPMHQMAKAKRTVATLVRANAPA